MGKKEKYRRLLLSLLALAVSAGLIFFLVRGVRQGLDTTEPTLPPPPKNPYLESDFYKEDGFIRCSRVDGKVGIDVSDHQGEIDWHAVKEAGVEYAMIRVGWRGYGGGSLNVDTCAVANYQGAREAGIPVGVYFYSQAVSTWEAVQEAKLVLQTIRDWEITYPVVYDWEWVSEEARTGQTDSRTVTDCTKAFCDTVAAAGHIPAFYFNQDLASNTFQLRELKDYDFWLAQYAPAMTFAYDVAMWQYSCTGSVPGIEGDVDLNLCFKNYEAEP